MNSMEVYESMEAGGSNDLVDRLGNDPAFGALDAKRLRGELEARRYTGRSPEQTEEFINEEIDPLLESLDRFAIDDDETISV